jgi:hypothetical protein
MRVRGLSFQKLSPIARRTIAGSNMFLALVVATLLAS